MPPSPPPIDVARARADTPGCRDLVHFNNAGAALPTERTLRTQIDHLELEARIGGYEAHDAQADPIQGIYDSVARLLNGAPTEVALMTSNTAGFDLFLYSLPWAEGDRLLTTQSEYGANYVAYLHLARRFGISVEVVPNNEFGELDVDALETMIDGRVRLISINHVPTNGGLVNPAAEVGRVARAHGITYLLDACQSAGQIPLDVHEIGCDALTATGRKFLRGPRGTGFLWVRQAVLETIHPVTIDHDAATWTSPTTYELKPDAARFEVWEKGWAGLLGLGAAVDDALAWGLPAIRDRIVEISEALRERLTDEVPDAEVHDLGRTRCGIVTFSLGDRDLPTVKRRLQEQGINVSTVPVGSALLDTVTRDLPPLMRASLHIYNTHDEIDALISALDPG
jgi:cysteine desulfurase/selenocysteine lyase